MTDEHASLWKDYQNHPIYGASTVERLLMGFIEAEIQSELDHLPKGFLTALWWNTENGRDALFDAEWNFSNRDAIEPGLGNPPQDQTIEDLTELILQEMANLAGREDMEEDQ